MILELSNPMAFSGFFFLWKLLLGLLIRSHWAFKELQERTIFLGFPLKNRQWSLAHLHGWIGNRNKERVRERERDRDGQQWCVPANGGDLAREKDPKKRKNRKKEIIFFFIFLGRNGEIYPKVRKFPLN